MKSFYKILKISILTIVALSVFFACSLPRPVEKSHPDRPEWVYGIERDYIIVEGVAETHQEAQNNALKMLRERIVSTAAVNISSEAYIEITEKTIENISRYSEDVSHKTMISTDFLSSLKGISPSRAQAYYWEKKKYPEKHFKVHYHIKYPFTKKEIDNLIAEWVEMDKGFAVQLDKLEKNIDNTNSVFDLISFKDEAHGLKNIFTGVRKTRVELLELQATQLLANLGYEVISHERGNILLKLSSMGKEFMMQTELVFSSSCAKVFQTRLIGDDNYLNIIYDPDFCNNQEKNTFQISQNYGEITIFSDYEIPPPDDEIRFAVSEPVRLRNLATYNSRHTEWHLPVRVFTDCPFIITKIELTVSRNSRISLRQLITGEDSQSFLQTNINQSIKNKGDFMISFRADSQLSTGLENFIRQFVNDFSSLNASGRIYFRAMGEQIEQSIDFEGVKIIESR
jgi:hypothetical protein